MLSEATEGFKLEDFVRMVAEVKNGAVLYYSAGSVGYELLFERGLGNSEQIRNRR